MLRLSVRDNGPGLPTENMKAVFDPFFTTKAGGTGLGMAITKRILDAHHASIDILGMEDAGLEVVLAIPRRQS